MSETLEVLATAVEALCLDASPPATDPDALAARLGVYRSMVRSRMRGVLVASAPRFVRAVGEDATRVWLTRWLDGDGPTTRIFWRLPLTAERAADTLVAEGLVTEAQRALLAFELTLWRVRHARFPSDPPAAPLAFDRAPRLTRAHARVDFAFDVTRDDLPEARTQLVVFRRADDSVGVRTLNRVGALVLDALLETGGASIADRARTLVTTHGLAGGEAFAAALGGMLADFVEDGLLLGACAEDDFSAAV